MTRPPFRILPPNGTGYRGLTALPLGNGREIVVADTGEEAEAEAVRAWEAANG